MQTFKYVLLVLILSFFHSGCKNDNTVTNFNNPAVDTASFIYPFDIGNYWNYQSISTVSDIRPDSLAAYFTEYPLYGSGILRIVKDTLMNGITARQFVDNFEQDSSSYTSKIYYINTDTALIQFAYSLQTSANIFPRTNKRIFIRFRNSSYGSVTKLIRSAKLNAVESEGDTLIYENPAPEAMRYPVLTNYQWVFRNFGLSVLTKKYINFENINVGSIITSCIKTEFKWSTIDDMEAYQYYTKYGKLRDYLYLDDVMVTDEFGNILGTIDIKDITNVTSFYVKEITP